MIRGPSVVVSMLFTLATMLILCAGRAFSDPDQAIARSGLAGRDLWIVYDRSLRQAKYIDLTHTVTPSIPVWDGFAPFRFVPAKNPVNGKTYRYAIDRFEATEYHLSTDQLGTQLDPPAHWAPG